MIWYNINMQTAFDKILYRNEVNDLLLKLNKILNDKDFNANSSLIFIFKSKNKLFMQSESFDTNDVVSILKKLEIKNYIKSVLDNKDIDGLYLHEFAIEYNNIKYVDVKFKIINEGVVIKVVSFHKNEYDFSFAYSCK